MALKFFLSHFPYLLFGSPLSPSSVAMIYWTSCLLGGGAASFKDFSLTYVATCVCEWVVLMSTDILGFDSPAEISVKSECVDKSFFAIFYDIQAETLRKFLETSFRWRKFYFDATQFAHEW